MIKDEKDFKQNIIDFEILLEEFSQKHQIYENYLLSLMSAFLLKRFLFYKVNSNKFDDYLRMMKKEFEIRKKDKN